MRVTNKYAVETSTGLSGWTTVHVLRADATREIWQPASPPAGPKQFYRLRISSAAELAQFGGG